MKTFFLSFVFIFSSVSLLQAETSSLPQSKMFSLSSEEMVFASKLSDENRRKFCYSFSVRERSLALQETDPNLSPDQKVEKVQAALTTSLGPEAQTRKSFR